MCPLEVELVELWEKEVLPSSMEKEKLNMLC